MKQIDDALSAARSLARTNIDKALAPLLRRQEHLAMAVGRMEARTVRASSYDELRDAEFSVFSQWGEDGIIQYLVSRVPIERPVFVEFGVEDYRESNTRFLLQNDHWRGLILDLGTDHIRFVESSDLQWRHSIDARSAFLNRDNINEVIGGAGITGDIGLLSVDVDGNDYWLLDAIDVVSPRILIVEYNSLFGPIAAVTVPYRSDFDRLTAHWSGLCYGASLAALDHLAAGRGYRLVGCNRAGNNAFFVREDVAGESGDLRRRSVAEAFVQRSHRESHDRTGRLSYVTDIDEQVALMADATIVDVRTGDTGTVAKLVR